jgi:tRNA A37 threonylcarbamoyladenosine dehydratase
MANPLFQRLSLLIGDGAAEALEKSRAIVFGIGGVGSWCAEALVRSGVGSITLVDSDIVSVSDFNRQVQASGENMGRKKTEALKERLNEINPACEVFTFPQFFSKENAGLFGISEADFVIDAIDTLESKLDLIEMAVASGKRLFSSMGMAWKLDPTQIKTADIWETSVCPLARFVRLGLRKRGFSGHFTVVYSTENSNQRNQQPRPKGTGYVGSDKNGFYAGLIPLQTIHSEVTSNALKGGVLNPPANKGSCDRDAESAENGGKRAPLGSAVQVTAAAGMVLASLVIRDICGKFSDSGGEAGPS